MDLQEAFFKQKIELRAANREIIQLKKQIERFQKGLAATETFQKQLSHIQGLNFKVSEMTHISDRYKSMYEQKVLENKRLSSIFYEYGQAPLSTIWPHIRFLFVGS